MDQDILIPLSKTTIFQASEQILTCVKEKSWSSTKAQKKPIAGAKLAVLIYALPERKS